MIELAPHNLCTGCTSCANTCPHHAITMQADGEGFLYPAIDRNLCVECGLCTKRCPILLPEQQKNESSPKAFALWSYPDRTVSSSGGAFSAFARSVIKKGGRVWGAAFVGKLKCRHVESDSLDGLAALRGSKYVQSDLGHVFRQVKKDLKDGLTVLFSGTPCQTAGLNSYIGKKLRDHLILVDIVCHGVPGPYLWRDYIAYLEKKHGDKICWVNFRDKQAFGWTAHKGTFKFVKGGGKMSFTYLFYQHIMFRSSCGKCHFTNTKRPSDITIADFWGWQKTAPDINKDDKGVSLILVNTAKGQELFDAIKNRMIVIPAQLEDCLQPNLQHPSYPHPLKEAFEHDYAKHGFVYVAKKYGDMGWRYRFSILKRKISTAKKLLMQRIGK